MSNLLNRFKMVAPDTDRKAVLAFILDVMGGEVPMAAFTPGEVKKACEKQMADAVEYFNERPDAPRQWRGFDWDVLEAHVISYSEWDHLADILTDSYWEGGRTWPQKELAALDL